MRGRVFSFLETQRVYLRGQLDLPVDALGVVIARVSLIFTADGSLAGGGQRVNWHQGASSEVADFTADDAASNAGTGQMDNLPLGFKADDIIESGCCRILGKGFVMI